MQTELQIRGTVPAATQSKSAAVNPAGSSAVRAERPWRLFLRALAFGVVLIIFFYVLIAYHHYYAAPLVQRPHLEEHALMKPAGTLGQGFGVVGSLMLLSLFGYSARKRLAFMKKWGTVRGWLSVHIFFGIAGPLFITLHTAFKFNGIVAVSYWSMIAVMLSGFVGRYLYAQIPHDIRGLELTLQEAQQSHQQLIEALQRRCKLSAPDLDGIENYLLGNIQEVKTTAAVLVLILTQDLVRWWRLRRVRRFLQSRGVVAHAELLQMIRLVRQQVLLRRRIHFFEAIQRGFHFWHVIHKPFAYVMLTIMFLHIAVVLALGYWWIFA